MREPKLIRSAWLVMLLVVTVAANIFVFGTETADGSTKASNRASGLSRYQRSRSTAQSDGLQEPDGGRLLHRRWIQGRCSRGLVFKGACRLQEISRDSGRAFTRYLLQFGRYARGHGHRQAWRSRCVLDFLRPVPARSLRVTDGDIQHRQTSLQVNLHRCPNRGNIACLSPASCRR